MKYISLLVTAIGVFCFQSLMMDEALAHSRQCSRATAANDKYAQRMKPSDISEINVVLADDVQLGVDPLIRFEVEVTYRHKDKVRVRSTVSKAFRSIIDWSDLVVEIQGGKRKGDNLVAVNPDLEGCTGGVFTISVRHKSNPDVTGSAQLQLYSGKPIVFNRKGSSGKDGRNALFGGKDAKAGENGECERAAQIGNDGWSGDHGLDGHNITAFIKKKFNPHVGRDVLYVALIDKTIKDTTYIIADTASLIQIVASGGRGGEGGNGTRGGDGYSEDPACCDPAQGGDGGDGGNGGNGGKIEMHIDTAIHADAIHLEYFFGPGYGGKGGDGGYGGSRGKCGYSDARTAAPGAKGSNGRDGKSGEVEVIYEVVGGVLLKFPF